MAAESKKRAGGRTRGDDVQPPLTAAERRELERRIQDADDPRRYLLVSATLPWFSLYYEIQEDAWLIDDPARATLFKRRATAQAIRDLLKPSVFVVPCTVDGAWQAGVELDRGPQGRQAAPGRAARVAEEEETEEVTHE